MSERLIGPIPFWVAFEERMLSMGYDKERARNETENFKSMVDSKYYEPEAKAKEQLWGMLDNIAAIKLQGK